MYVRSYKKIYDNTCISHIYIYMGFDKTCPLFLLWKGTECSFCTNDSKSTNDSRKLKLVITKIPVLFFKTNFMVHKKGNFWEIVFNLWKENGPIQTCGGVLCSRLIPTVAIIQSLSNVMVWPLNWYLEKNTYNCIQQCLVIYTISDY